MTGYPHRANLLFAVPLTGRPIPPDVMFAFHSMACPMNYNFMVHQIRGKPVDEARNEYAEVALANDCKYIFFWDEDVACPPHSIPELVYKMEHHPEAAAIGGIYCLKRDPPEPLVFRGNGNGPFWDWKAGEFFEVSGIGMGCTLVRTEVFKDLKKPWFKTEFNYTKMLDGYPGLESWTEDLWFCQRVTDTGKWKVYADASLLCAHYDMTTCKPYTLPPDSKPVRHLQVPHGSKKILDIGSGKSPYQTSKGTIVRADPEEKYNPDYRCDLHKLPFASKEYDIVFSAALEQYGRDETEELLTEWTRVMKPDGELRLVLSGQEFISKQVAEGKLNLRDLLARNNKTAFEYEEIEKILNVIGMKSVERVASDPAHLGIRAKWQTQVQ
jgi:hypothetical protein